MIKISVVIPTFNRPNLVLLAVNSVLAQTVSAAEIIVVDDGSILDMREVLSGYGSKIQIVRQINAGLSAARNAGIQRASSDWIAFLDDDDEYEDTRLASAVRSISIFPNATVHAVNTSIISENKPSIDLFAIRGISLTEPTQLKRPLSAILKGCFFAQSMVIQKELLLRVGLFRSFPYEDLDLFVRLAAYTPWALDPSPLLRLIRRSDSNYNLSANLRAKRISSCEDLVRVHREALRLDGLTDTELRLVRTGLGTNLFNLGTAFATQGNQKLARDCFGEAARVFPAHRSRLKSVAARFGGRAILFLIEGFTRKPTCR